jgi:hypothetical protein
MKFLRKPSKKVHDYSGRKRLSLYPKSSTSKEPIKKSSSQSNPDSNALNVEKKIRRITIITVITMGIVLLLLESTGVTNLFHQYNDDSLFTDSNGENQITDKGEYTSSWTGTYKIEMLTYSIFNNGVPDCGNIITGNIHFEITQKSNGEFDGIITTTNDKEVITILDEDFADMPGWCIPFMVGSVYGDGEKAGERIPSWFNGVVNDANGLNIDWFEIYLFDFESFTVNRVGDTLTTKYVQPNEYDEGTTTFTFSVTKDAE